MAHTITLIPGDGIGPEIAEATRRVIDATGIQIDWEVHQAGESVMAKNNGDPLPVQVLDSIKRNKTALKGPITTPIGSTGFRSVNVALRQELELFSCVRPCKTYPGIRSRFENVDFIIVRENMEDLYAGIEYEAGKPETIAFINDLNSTFGKHLTPEDTGITIKPTSDHNTTRVVQWAFDYARKNKRRRVTAITKANIMKYTDGYFLDIARRVAEKNKDIRYDEYLIDALCMQLVRNPENYDVLVLPNIYGDIVSDLGAGLIGGLGVAPGANMGDELAVFEPTHGSAARYAGMNKTNPVGMMLSGVLMLRHLGETDRANRLENAIAAVLKEGNDVTYDLKANRDDPTAATTSGMGDAIIAQMQKE